MEEKLLANKYFLKEEEPIMGKRRSKQDV